VRGQPDRALRDYAIRRILDGQYSTYFQGGPRTHATVAKHFLASSVRSFVSVEAQSLDDESFTEKTRYIKNKRKCFAIMTNKIRRINGNANLLGQYQRVRENSLT
jgi:hypothetical protein